MKRIVLSIAVLAAGLVVIPGVLRADVKTVEKTAVKFEGLIGSMMNRAGGGDSGLTTTVSLKGQRMASISGQTGQVVDLGEQKIYELDVKKKEYTVMTFTEMRQMMEDAQRQMAEGQRQMGAAPMGAQDDLQGKETEYDVDVKPTGQTRSIAGQSAREIVITVTAREKGKKVEESGGGVMTNTVWIGPHVSALDELRDFQMRYARALLGDGANADQAMAQAAAFLPVFFKEMSSRMAAELGRQNGTVLASTMKVETIRGTQTGRGAPAPQQPPPSGGIGGIMGRMMNRGGGGQNQPRSTVMTTTSEIQSIGTTVSADDIAIPAGFKEKKK